MNYSTVKYFCTTNGPGVRTALFVSGCNIHCEGCFNKEAWSFKYGKTLTDKKIDEILTSVEPEYISGLSVLGGEPLDDKNVDRILEICQKFRDKFGDTKTLWMWSGYTLDEIHNDKKKSQVLEYLDVIVDGPFKKDLYDINLQYRGSSNQGVTYLKKCTF